MLEVSEVEILLVNLNWQVMGHLKGFPYPCLVDRHALGLVHDLEDNTKEAKHISHLLSTISLSHLFLYLHHPFLLDRLLVTKEVLQMEKLQPALQLPKPFVSYNKGKKKSGHLCSN